MGRSPGWLSHVEAGRLRISITDLGTLLEIYGLTEQDPLLHELIERARSLSNPWWSSLTGLLDRRDVAFLANEAEADLIRTYEVALIPGLLQTEQYARAVLATRLPAAAPEVVDRRLGVRMSRQQVLMRPGPAELHAVISEAALAFQVGGPEVHAQQIRHLIDQAAKPNIRIQILPFTAGALPAGHGSFTLLNFGPDEPRLASAEQQGSSTWLTQDASEVAELAAVFDTLVQHAMLVEDSVRRMKEYE